MRREALRIGHINKGAKIHFQLADVQDSWLSLANGYGDASYLFAFNDHNGTTGPAGAPTGTYAIGSGFGDRLTDPKDACEIIAKF